MKSLDDFIGGEDKKKLDFSCKCNQCDSSNTEVYKADDKDMFNAVCLDCKNKFSFRLYGLGQIF